MNTRSRRSARSHGTARAAAGIAATAATVLALTLAGTTAASAAGHVSYAGAVPSWATSANDAGAAAADETVEGEIYLPLRNKAAAEAVARSVSDPSSRRYRKKLSPSTWISTFSPTAATLKVTTDYLKASGLTVTGVPDSRQYVVFRGTADAVGAAFGTDLHTYDFSGEKVVAPSSAPSLPASVASSVQGVTLDQGRLLTRPDSVTPESASATAAPTQSETLQKAPAATAAPVPMECSTYIGQHTVTVPRAYGSTKADTYNCGYTPSQLRSAYGLKSLNAKGVDGAGQTVAIIDAYGSPTALEDANTYATANGDPQLTSSTYQEIVPDASEFVDQEACGFPSGWQGEQMLDIESAHGVAPGAKILYVGGDNCGGGLDLAMSTILDKGLANIVSNSYGYVGEDVGANQLMGEVDQHIQAAAEGIGLYFSSGDNGDEAASLGYASPDFPASSPWVTAVGGTSLAIGKDGKKVYETGWGTSRDEIVTTSGGSLAYTEDLPGTYRYGAGGGVSAQFAQPWYQKGAVPASLAQGNRVSPDLSAIADPYTGYAIGYQPIVDDTTLEVGAYEDSSSGGTSLAAPVTAAMMAIVQQSVHSSIGFANPTIYALHKAAPSLFTDVVPSRVPHSLAFTNDTTGQSFLVTLDTDTSLRTSRGYDDVTGLGSLSFGLASSIGHGRR